MIAMFLGVVHSFFIFILSFNNITMILMIDCNKEGERGSPICLACVVHSFVCFFFEKKGKTNISIIILFSSKTGNTIINDDN